MLRLGFQEYRGMVPCILSLLTSLMHNVGDLFDYNFLGKL